MIHFDHMIGSQMVAAERQRVHVSQAALSRASGVSRVLINRYENGKVDPTTSQMDRLLGPLDRELTTRRRYTRDERRTLGFARAVANKLKETPDLNLDAARQQLRRQTQRSSPNERIWLGVWEKVLDLPLPILTDVLTSDSEFARALRQSSPLTVILTDAERREVMAITTPNA